MRKPIEQKSPLAAWAATIRGIEGGSKGASARLRRLLAEVYGTTMPGALPEPAPADNAAVIAALDRQTRALEDLARTVREGQDRQAGAFDGLADGLLELLVQLTSEHVGNGVARARQPAAKP